MFDLKQNKCLIQQKVCLQDSLQKELNKYFRELVSNNSPNLLSYFSKLVSNKSPNSILDPKNLRSPKNITTIGQPQNFSPHSVTSDIIGETPKTVISVPTPTWHSSTVMKRNQRPPYNHAVMLISNSFCRLPTHKLVSTTSQGQCEKVARLSPLLHVFSVIEFKRRSCTWALRRTVVKGFG